MKRKASKGNRADPTLREIAFSLFCFGLSQSEIAKKLKVSEGAVAHWGAGEKWIQKRQLVLREQAEAKGGEIESLRNSHRQAEADLSRKCWAQALLALNRLDIRKPKTQDIKNLAEIASILGRRALNMPMHDALELTVNHNHDFAESVKSAIARVLNKTEKPQSKLIEASVEVKEED